LCGRLTSSPFNEKPNQKYRRQETTHVVLRSVTARAVQRVLARLGTVDRASYFWLADFARRHPPIEGGAFVARLLAEPPVAVADDEEGGGGKALQQQQQRQGQQPQRPQQQQQRVVYPAQLASAVLATRAELARDVARALEDCAAREGVAVLREHLRAHTYTTSNAEAPRARYSVARGAAGAAAAASGSAALWRELRRRGEGGGGGSGSGAGEGLGGR